MFFCSLFLVIMVYLLFSLMFYKKLIDMEMMSSYECGFDFNSLTRFMFSYRFFLISILFIIFDVEISLMIPVPFLMESELGLWVFIMFMLILIVGLLYEYSYGALDWLNIVIKS
uniref:NADH-ubiquinone oxidoreductase chain 3 n=1 Tax=Cheiracanthium brevispinum TaxID=2773961 RepID=A0AA51VI11_9ARAC|nr:NADH dehydrogenase subunit 3 [Cheiracanthium brevispinum]WMX19912.1 NADH dehydrogenase subunit 3 [Cheiracanthium brevispinum]